MKGMNVIADTTFLKYMTIEDMQQLDCETTYLIDVKCDLEVLEQRELERKDRPVGAAKCTLNSAIATGKMIAKSILPTMIP